MVYSSLDAGDRAACLAAGANAFLVKPYDLAAFRQAIGGAQADWLGTP